ncbi:MAG: hypothetical protein KFKLKKLM_02205 [Flavobacteriales bacterium]|nr:hypothetical protein [Flavobacteriales bacterium]
MSNKTRASNNIIVIFKRGQIPQKNLEIKLKYHFKKGQIPQKGQIAETQRKVFNQSETVFFSVGFSEASLIFSFVSSSFSPTL